MENVTAQKIDKLEIFNAIGLVYELAKDSKLENILFDTLQEQLKLLSTYFKINNNQSLLFSIIFSLNYKGSTVELNDLIKFFSCAPTKILEFSDDLTFLIEQGYLETSYSNSEINISLANLEFSVNANITDALLENRMIPELEKPKIESIYNLLEETYELINSNNKNHNASSRINLKFNRKIVPKDKYGIIKELRDKDLSDLDIMIYFYVTWQELKGVWEVNIANCFEYIYGNGSEMIAEVQKVHSGKNMLIKLKYIELRNIVFMNDMAIMLTNKSKKFLKTFDIIFKKTKKGKRKTIKPQKIADKQLFYNAEEEKQIETITQVLEETKFKETRKRLSEKKLPKGINIVFYGPPGTGKTESVLQIAKATNREIVKVDISASKSMWFGESEKITKKIFTDYKETAKLCKQMPILFLNEADALFSKRNENANSAVSKTENTIQNIFLEELENFKGILIATTNLVGNMDKAFERRFLFKVEINNPTAEVKANIWKEKLQHLNPDEAMILAKTFDFSGGQIENIVRKKEIEEIIQGKAIRFEEIYSFCKAELFEKSYGKIGFGVK